MFVLAINQKVEKYPYTLVDLKKDNKNTSFPANPSEETLAAWNVFPVTDTPKPTYNDAIERLVEQEPILLNGKWVKSWKKIELSAEEQQLVRDMQEIRVRNQRNSLLAETDWRFRSDMNPSQAWIDYCQALRDITSQAGFPWNVQWPSQPE